MFGLRKGGRGEPGKSEGNERKFKSTKEHKSFVWIKSPGWKLSRNKKQRLEERKLGGHTTYDSKGQGWDRTPESMILTQDFLMLLKCKCIATVFLGIDLLMCIWHIRKYK